MDKSELVSTPASQPVDSQISIDPIHLTDVAIPFFLAFILVSILFYWLSKLVEKERKTEGPSQSGVIDALGAAFSSIALYICYLLVQSFSDEALVAGLNFVVGIIGAYCTSSIVHTLRAETNRVKSIDKVHGAVKALEDPSHAFRVTEAIQSDSLKESLSRFSSDLIAESSSLDKSLLQVSQRLADKEFEKIVRFAELKAINAYRQLSSGVIFLRQESFQEHAWKDLVSSTERYLSVCDLSMYATMPERLANGYAAAWRRRAGNEARVLSQIKAEKPGVSRKFDKVILFSPRKSNDIEKVVKDDGNDSQESAIQGDENNTSLACNVLGQDGQYHCNGISGQCGDKSCVVNVVIDSWKKVQPTLKRDGYQSSFQNSENTSLVWVAEKSAYLKTNPAGLGGGEEEEASSILSCDIGLFGDNIIGEEFKTNLDETSVAAGDNTDFRPSQADLVQVKFLYRFQVRPNKSRELIDNIKDLVIRNNVAKPVP